jgi:hypothetical protein
MRTYRIADFAVVHRSANRYVLRVGTLLQHLLNATRTPLGPTQRGITIYQAQPACVSYIKTRLHRLSLRRASTSVSHHAQQSSAARTTTSCAC